MTSRKARDAIADPPRPGHSKRTEKGINPRDYYLMMGVRDVVPASELPTLPSVIPLPQHRIVRCEVCEVVPRASNWAARYTKTETGYVCPTCHKEDTMSSSRKDTDAWLQRTSEALGVTPEQMAVMDIDDLMQKGLDKRDSYALRKLATAEVQGEGADHSLAKRILKVLANAPDGSIKDIDALRSALFFVHEDLEASNKDITKAVWSLQKRNLVTFYERKAGRDSLLTKIKLTRQGLRDQGVIPEHDSAKPDKVRPSRELKRPSKVGKDMTDANRHHYIAKGDQVEVVHEGIPVYKPNLNPQGVDMSQPMKVSARDFPEPLAQNMKPVIDVSSVPVSASEGKASMRKYILDTHTEYPILTELLGRADKQAAFEMAAEALDGVDDVTAAVLRNRTKLSTPLEAEILKLISKMG